MKFITGRAAKILMKLTSSCNAVRAPLTLINSYFLESQVEDVYLISFFSLVVENTKRE